MVLTSNNNQREKNLILGSFLSNHHSLPLIYISQFKPLLFLLSINQQILNASHL